LYFHFVFPRRNLLNAQGCAIPLLASREYDEGSFRL
jgi:hypothetical protein